MPKSKRTLWVITSILYAAALVYLSLRPTTAPVETGTMVIIRRWLFNLLHIPAYALLAGLVLQAIGRRRTHALLTACLLALTVGMLTELFQFYVQGRYFSVIDILLNAAGVLLALVLIHRLKGKGVLGIETLRTQ